MPAAVVVEELLVVILAAQEPPSVALTRLLDGAARGAAPVTEAVTRETLRLWPPAFAVLRRLTEPREIAGHALPAGAHLVLPLPLLHRDRRAFADPDRFLPERWAAGQTEATFAPFGLGARRCVGEPLAHLYVDAILPAVLRRVRLAPATAEPDRMVLRGTALVPEAGARVRVTRP
jgi:cytochrome P450